jgi:hypothetical protein
MAKDEYDPLDWLSEHYKRHPEQRLLDQQRGLARLMRLRGVADRTPIMESDIVRKLLLAMSDRQIEEAKARLSENEIKQLGLLDFDFDDWEILQQVLRDKGRVIPSPESLKKMIVEEIHDALERLGADAELLSIVERWGGFRLDDMTALTKLQAYNAGEKASRPLR